MARGLWVVVAGVLIGAVIGAAASLTLTATSLGAGTAALTRCTSGALIVTELPAGGPVTSVTVAGLPAACGGGTLYADVDNGTLNSSGTAVVPAGGGAVTVTLAAAVAQTADTEADILVSGP